MIFDRGEMGQLACRLTKIAAVAVRLFTVAAEEIRQGLLSLSDADTMNVMQLYAVRTAFVVKVAGDALGQRSRAGASVVIAGLCVVGISSSGIMVCGTSFIGVESLKVV